MTVVGLLRAEANKDEAFDEPRRAVEEIVDQLAAGDDVCNAADAIVDQLRRADYGILDFLVIIKAARERVARTCEAGSEELLRRLSALDDLLHLCVARTSAIHEEVLEESLRAYAELDGDGHVIFANRAMRQLLPKPPQVELASLFGNDAAYVRDALAGRVPRRVRRLYLQHDGLERPRLVSGEFSPLRGSDEVAAYAIIVDLQAFEAADHKLYEAHPAGVAKLELDFSIGYANAELGRLCNLTKDQLLGLKFDDLFPDAQSQRRLARAKGKLDRGEGQDEELSLGEQASPVSVTLIPMFDDQGERSHVIATIRSLALQKARLAIHLACEREKSHEKILQAVTDIVRPFVPFEFAGFYIYDETMSWARPICIVPRPEPPWPTNWFPVTEELRSWIMGDETFAPDMEPFVTEHPERNDALGDDPTFLRLVGEGCHAFVCLALRRGERAEAVLCLVSRDIGAYGPEDLEILRDLGVENALRAVLSAYRRAEHSLSVKLTRAIANASSIGGMAETIVRELANFYQWQNVSFLLINRVSRVFEVQAQAAGPVDGFYLDASFSQPLGHGVLGECLCRQHYVLLNNTEDADDPLAQLFRRVHPATRSELVMPIKVGGRVQFMLNLEDSRYSAFRQPEIDSLGRLIEDLEKALEQRRLDMILEEVLQAANDGIIITDLEGNIDKCNRKAQQLLKMGEGLEADPPKNIAEALVDPEDREACERVQDFPRRHVVIVGAGGHQRSVFLTSKILGEEFNQRVFFLEDIKELEWQYDMRAIRATLAEAAHQTRMPLALAGSLVRRVGRLLGNPSGSERIGDTLETCIRALERVDLTFERVMANARARPAGGVPLEPVKLAPVLEQVILELLPAERDMIQVSERCASLPPVLVEYRAFTFVLRSLIAHLLRHSGAQTRAIADAEAIDGNRCARILLRAPAGDDEPDRGDDAISALKSQAWADAAYGDAAVRAVVEDQLQGRFERRSDPDGEEVFELVLLLAHPNGPAAGSRELR